MNTRNNRKFIYDEFGIAHHRFVNYLGIPVRVTDICVRDDWFIAVVNTRIAFYQGLRFKRGETVTGSIRQLSRTYLI